MRSDPFPAPAPPRHISLVAETVRILREAIDQGLWQERLPGERLLCARLQVSRPTLRAALEELRKSGWIAVAARERRRICKRPGAGASHIVAPKIIGVLSPSPTHSLVPLALVSLDALRERLAPLGYTVQLHVHPACYSARPARALEKLTREHPCACWMLMGTLEPIHRWFLQVGIRVVVMGTPKAEIPLPSIDTNYRAVCRHATALLLRRGHKSLAIVLPKGIHGGDAESRRGFLEALASRADRVAHRVLEQDGTTPGICRLLDAALRSADPPTAFLVARAPVALTAMTHLLRQRIRIPQEIALVSRDDDAYLHYAQPAITRYAVDHAEFARRLAMMVRRLAEDGIAPERPVRLMPKFLPGETS